jgi:hypothetical protein
MRRVEINAPPSLVNQAIQVDQVSDMRRLRQRKLSEKCSHGLANYSQLRRRL